MNLKKYGLGLSMLLATAIATSCGSKEEEKEEPKNALEAMQQMADKAEAMKDKAPVEPVDFRELRDLLPKSVGGLDQTEATGEKNGAAGFTVSQAEARYNSGESSIDVKIIDTGGIGGFGMMGLAAWTMMSVDKETATGYEKTTMIEGYKGYEKYDNGSKSGEVNVLVADRYVVTLNGSGVTMDQMKEAVGSIDLKKLAKLE